MRAPPAAIAPDRWSSLSKPTAVIGRLRWLSLSKPTAVIASVVAGSALMFGCGRGPTSAEAEVAVDESRSAVQAAALEKFELSGSLGYEVPSAGGGWTTCSAVPPQLSYRVAGLAVGADPAEATPAIAAALEAAGWQVQNAGREPEVNAVLVRDRLRVSIGQSRRNPGSTGMSVTGRCVATTPEQDYLLSERDQVRR